jgi:hypothetical protein
MKLVNPYHWLYAKIYLQLLTTGTANINFSAIGLVITMLNMNLVIVVGLIHIFFDIRIYAYRLTHVLSVEIALLCVFFWFAAHFFYFYYKGRYKKILLEFDVDAKLKEPYCYLPALIYYVASILSMFLLIPIRAIYEAH